MHGHQQAREGRELDQCGVACPPSGEASDVSTVNMSESLESTAALARARTCDTRHSGRWEAAEGHRVHEVLAWTIHLICEDAHITEGALRIQGGVAGAPALSADACGRVEAVKWCRGRSKSDVCGTGERRSIARGFAWDSHNQDASSLHTAATSWSTGNTTARRTRCWWKRACELQR